MSTNQLPVYSIEDFRHFSLEHDFYADSLSNHLRQHHFIAKAHRHDFYLLVLFTKGSGTHQVDFHTYPVEAGALFVLYPGQAHHWILSPDAEGYIFFHTSSFFGSAFPNQYLQEFPFFNSIQGSPYLKLNLAESAEISGIFNLITEEDRHKRFLKHQKIRALVHLVYIELARVYSPQEKIRSKNSLIKITLLNRLIDEHFKRSKNPGFYAEMMHLSENHLNRICKTTLNKTCSALIHERIILEAKRMLINSSMNVSEVAEELGYTDHSYFSRLFKKQSGEKPLEFLRKHQGIL